MKLFAFALAALFSLSQLASAAEISGDYLEARTCDVYTGPCFANAEMDLAGKEALMAWKVDQGGWQGVSLAGLSVAVVVCGDQTLGTDGVFAQKPTETKSVVLVDQKATAEQQKALVAFAKSAAAPFTRQIVKVVAVPMDLKANFVTNEAKFTAGNLATIETRGVRKGDCVCTNEVVFYQPLTAARNVTPAYSLTQSFQGEGLDNRWTSHNTRSSFLGTFSR